MPLEHLREANVKTAIDFLVGRPCEAAIADASAGSAAAGSTTTADKSVQC